MIQEFVYDYVIYIYIYLLIYLFIYLFIYLSICLFIYLFIYYNFSILTQRRCLTWKLWTLVRFQASSEKLYLLSTCF